MGRNKWAPQVRRTKRAESKTQWDYVSGSSLDKFLRKSARACRDFLHISPSACMYVYVFAGEFVGGRCTGWTFFFFINLFIYLFIYLWLCWVFVSVQGLSLVAASGGHSSSRCAGLSLSRPLLLQSTGPRRAGSVVVAHGPSCSVACGIFPDQGSNPCPPHWQADSQPLHHQGSPRLDF